MQQWREIEGLKVEMLVVVRCVNLDYFLFKGHLLLVYNYIEVRPQNIQR